MDATAGTMEQLLERFLAWARDNDDIRAVVLIGSRARAERPADAWSDTDLIVVARAAQHYLETTAWLEEIGEPWLTFLERTADEQGWERRVLFAGVLDVDFALLSLGQFVKAMQGGMGAEVAGRGLQVLLDKDGLAAQVRLPTDRHPPASPPTQAEFLQAVNDFLYHAVWTAKKLRRGELWVGKSCCDSYMKQLLRQMAAWHARALHGWDYDTWFGGRFLEEWADPRVLQGLRAAFAHYDETDVWRALFATMDLFQWVAGEVAERLGYAYPTASHERVAQWILGVATTEA